MCLSLLGGFKVDGTGQLVLLLPVIRGAWYHWGLRKEGLWGLYSWGALRQHTWALPVPLH